MVQKNNITDVGYNQCTGCGACCIICPEKCISFDMNEQGFYTPTVNESDCINCGLCKEVCYKYLEDNQIVPKADYQGKKVIAVLNNYLEQMHTVTTAGVATQLAKYYFRHGYNVCGVTFDPKADRCEHIIVKNEDDILKLKGSKYLQSSCFNSFNKLYKYPGKSIIFGTPCQIYGFRQLIKHKKIEEKFILVDLYCAGVPSFNLWKQYKEFLQRTFKLKDIDRVNFRDKTQSWHKFSIRVKDENNNEYRQNLFNDLFFSFFLKKACFNKSCYDCKLRRDAIFSDMRLGDFWGDKYKIFDDGVGLVVLFTEKGEKAWESIKSSFRFEICKIQDIFDSQKINRAILPDHYNDVIKAFECGEKLEIVSSRYKINEIGYKAKKEGT